jgi:hypothetical protein
MATFRPMPGLGNRESGKRVNQAVGYPTAPAQLPLELLIYNFLPSIAIKHLQLKYAPNRLVR